MISKTEKSTALTFASWLDSIATQGAKASSLLLIIGLTAMVAAIVINTNSATTHSPALGLAALAVFALHSLALWPLERVLCLRLQFDAKLFGLIGLNQYESLADLDNALNSISLRKKDDLSMRDLASRINGTRGLIRLYAWTLAAQLILVILSATFFALATYY
jgi:hypothetical protein